MRPLFCLVGIGLCGIIFIMNMRCLILSVLMCYVTVWGARADVLQDAQDALDVARVACSGLSDDISRVSGLAVAGVATNAAGAIAGGAAVGVGAAKAANDKERLSQRVNISCDFQTVYELEPDAHLGLITAMSDIYTEQSKKLGNWRTGLMVGAGMTHIASAVLAGINMNQSELVQHVTACNAALDHLVSVRKQLADAGINPFSNPVRGRVENVVNACEKINVADVQKIERKEKVVVGSSATGAAMAIAGVVTSASANSDKMRSAADVDGMQKFNKLNAASNALAGVSAAGSLVSTIAGAGAVKLVRQMMRDATRCAEALNQ